jgi:hypothetical protein
MKVCLTWTAAVIVFVLMFVARGYAEDDPEKKIVAAGDDFILTQKVVDAYQAFFVSQKLQWSQDEIIKTALKYELLSREYRAKQGDRTTVEDSARNSDTVEAKILDGKKYIQNILDSWVVSDAVIEAYYRSNPEKYGVGNKSDGKIMIRPLDDKEKSEIRFRIIEDKKGVIAKEFVDSLISKYHIIRNK